MSDNGTRGLPRGGGAVADVPANFGSALTVEECDQDDALRPRFHSGPHPTVTGLRRRRLPSLRR